MKSHDLAKILLENENLDIAVQAYKHHHNSVVDRKSHGSTKIYINKYCGCREILITPDSDDRDSQVEIELKIFDERLNDVQL
jgi:hypothetical protein